MDYSLLSNVVNTFFRHKVNHVVISPGSRSAPLTLSFARHSGFRKYIIPDERSAAFIACGIAQETHNPVILVCTSGTAAYNYAPAIAEAFYQQIPLIVLTADRPPEWIGQSDGQSIYQPGLYGRNIKWSCEMPANHSHEDSDWHMLRLVSESVREAITFPYGPVHINFPFREPLYPNKAFAETPSVHNKMIRQLNFRPMINESEWKDLAVTWEKSSRILIVPGQSSREESVIQSLIQAANYYRFPIFADILSNLNGLPDPFIYASELFLSDSALDKGGELCPDLLITFGKSVLSKNLKLFLRKFKPANHWHIQPAGPVADTFQSLTHIVPMDTSDFFSQSTPQFKRKDSFKSYADQWLKFETHTKKILSRLLCQKTFNELDIVKLILKFLPDECNLHLSNSLPVRLANYIGLEQKSISVYANRGTNGIDGCTSTAVGISLSSGKLNVLISGDMAFFYDRNALWHKYDIGNLKIILLNNHGGGIFRMLDGPADLPELKEYFETDQFLHAENTAKDFNLDYMKVANYKSLQQTLPEFFGSRGRAGILEIETDGENNRSMFLEILNEIKSLWN